MIKLLDKPLKTFTTYALVVLLCSIPVYFVMIDFIWVHEINEHNRLVAEATKKNINRLKLDGQELSAAIELWNTLQPEAKIQPVSRLKADSTYSIYRKDPYRKEVYIEAGEYDRFQGLVTYFKLNNQVYSLTVEANVEESYETIIAITAITVMFFIILLVGFIRLNKNLSRKIWKPFYETLAHVKHFSLTDNKPAQFVPSNIVEFQELNESIGKLIEGNLATFKRQKEFTENASHELQTPLAIVQSKLDLLIQDDALSAAQSQLIEETNNALSRISRINKNLLLLAKIENQQFLDKQIINMSAALKTIMDLMSGLLDTRPITVQIVEECSVEANSTLVEIMVTNLLMNAVRYTSEDAPITIALLANQLIILNQGQYALDKAMLFGRFSAVSLQTPGSGLGLSIVKEIADQHGWYISYSFDNGMHSFAVEFPKR